MGKVGERLKSIPQIRDFQQVAGYQEQVDEAAHAKERKIQEAMLGIKKKYGKNAILKGMNLEDGATARERNQTIGGHQA